MRIYINVFTFMFLFKKNGYQVKIGNHQKEKAEKNKKAKLKEKR